MFKMAVEDSKSCLLCFKNDLQLQDLSTPDEFDKTCFDKLQFIMNCDIVIYECNSICNNCNKELNQAYQFRIKLETGLQYWSTRFDLKEENDKFIIIGLDNDESNFDFIESKEELKTETNFNDIENNVKHNRQFQAMTTFDCYRCKIVFRTAAELLHHKCCPIKKENIKCSKETVKKTHIKVKTMVKIAEPKKHVCNICNEAFRRPHHLLEHSTKHTGERNFKCSFCEKTFQRLSSVSRHMKSHDAVPGQKAKKSPFLCTICGKNFPYSNAMQRHMRMHKGIKPHKCQICNKRFSQNAHVKVHMRTHTGEKPFICDECGAAFKFNQTLQKHLSKH